MRRVTLKELEQARKILAAKRYACGDGLLQDALEIGEALIKLAIHDMGRRELNYILLEEPE